MSEIINGFAYDESLLSALKTARHYEQTCNEIRAAAKTSESRDRPYDSWMNSRRMVEYLDHLARQGQEIHGIARNLMFGKWACTCGLIAGPIEEEVRFEALLHTPGHIQTGTREPVSLFVTEVYVSQEVGRQRHYWCVNCGDIGNTIPAADGSVSARGLKAVRSSHKCEVSK